MLNRTQENFLFGLDTVWKDSIRISVSDPHRTILDMLARPPVVGGIRHVADCLEVYLGSSLANLGKMIGYAERLGNGAVFKRLGFLLERAETPDTRAIEACHQRMSTGNAKLDPALGSDTLVKRWRLWLPVAWQDRALDD